MILEREQLVERVAEVLATAFIDAAIQYVDEDDEPVASTAVPSWADGDVVFLEGAFSLDSIARAIVQELER